MNKRDMRLDTMRGILLVMMTLNHLEWRLKDYTAEPFGFVTAAEGFILLSAYTYAITSRINEVPFMAMVQTAGQRALKIYKYHVLALATLLVVALAVPAYGEIFGKRFFGNAALEVTSTTIVGGLTLVHQPKFFDILPMYMVFALLTPLVLYGLQQGRAALVLLGSVALWLAGHAVNPTHAAAAALGLGSSIGYFNLFSWQLLWVLGLYFGFAHKHGQGYPIPRHSLLLTGAIIVIAICLLARHAMIDVPDDVRGYFEKGNLGVFRLANVLAQLMLLFAFIRAINRDTGLPWFRFIGAWSLQVFTYHIVMVYLAKPFGWRVTGAFGTPGDIVFNLVLVASLTIPALVFARLKGKTRAARLATAA